MNKHGDGCFWFNGYSVGFDVNEAGDVTFAVFDPKTNAIVALHKAPVIIDAECEVVNDPSDANETESKIMAVYKSITNGLQ